MNDSKPRLGIVVVLVAGVIGLLGFAGEEDFREEERTHQRYCEDVRLGVYDRDFKGICDDEINDQISTADEVPGQQM